MVLFVLPILVAVSTGVSIIILRRRARHLTEERILKCGQIAQILASHPNLSLHVPSTLPKADRRILKDASLSGPDFRWMVAGASGLPAATGRPSINDCKDAMMSAFLLQRGHQEVTHYMVECALRFAEMYGHVIVCRDNTQQPKKPKGGKKKQKGGRNNNNNEEEVVADPEPLETPSSASESEAESATSSSSDTTSSSSFLGCVCLIPPYASKALYAMHYKRATLVLGRPVPHTMDQTHDVGTRYDAYMESLDSHHYECMGDQPHWVLCHIGVADKAQRRGVGRLLMQVAQEIVMHFDHENESETKNNNNHDSNNSNNHHHAENATPTATPVPAPPLYLACHDGNVPFFEKMGLKQERRFLIVPFNTLEDATPFNYNCMVYQPPPTATTSSSSTSKLPEVS